MSLRLITIRLLVGLSILTVSVAVAGCGGHSKKVAPTVATTSATPNATSSGAASASKKVRYEQQMQKLGTELGKTLADVGNNDQQLITNGAGAESQKTETTGIAVQLRTAQRGLLHAAAQLSKINPPANVRAEHEALRKAVLEYAKELDPIIAAVRRGSISQIATISSLKGVIAMQNASQAITAKGYSIL